MTLIYEADDGIRTVSYAPGLKPICVGCPRPDFGMHIDLGVPDPAWREEHCSLCGYRTNHGLYLEYPPVPF